MPALMLGSESALAAAAQRRRGIFYLKTDTQWPDAQLRALRSLSDEALGLDINKLAEVASSVLERPIAGIAPLTSRGTFHRLFRLDLADGEPAVLRIAARKGDEMDAAMALSPAITTLLERASVGGPRSLVVDLSRRLVDRDYEILSLVPGVQLATLEADEIAMRRLLEALGGTLARLHATRIEGFGPLDPSSASFATSPRGLFSRWGDYVLLNADQHVSHLLAAREIDTRTAVAIAARLASLASVSIEHGSLLHGDLGGHNVHVRAESIAGLVDWEDALVGDPLFDLASAATFQPERRHAALIEGYCREPAPAPHFEWRFWTYYLRIAVAKQVHRMRFGYQDQPGREPAVERIYRALAKLDHI